MFGWECLADSGMREKSAAVTHVTPPAAGRWTGRHPRHQAEGDSWEDARRHLTWKTERKPVDMQVLSVIIRLYNQCRRRLGKRGSFLSFARGASPRLRLGTNLIRQDDYTLARSNCQPGQQKLFHNGNCTPSPLGVVLLAMQLWKLKTWGLLQDANKTHRKALKKQQQKKLIKLLQQQYFIFSVHGLRNFLPSIDSVDFHTFLMAPLATVYVKATVWRRLLMQLFHWKAVWGHSLTTTRLPEPVTPQNFLRRPFLFSVHKYLRLGFHLHMPRWGSVEVPLQSLEVVNVPSASCEPGKSAIKDVAGLTK